MAMANAVTYLDFNPSSIGPTFIFCHAVYVAESFEPHLDLPSVVENTTVTIQEIGNGRFVEVIGSISKDGVIPALEIRVLCDEAWKSIPFVGGCDEARSVGTNVRW